MSQFLAASAVGVLLLLIGFLFWMQKSLKPVLARLQGEQVVTAFLDPSVTEKDESQLLDSIRISLGAQGSPEVKLVTAAEFVSHLKLQYPDLGRELEDLGKDMQEVVPKYISISGILLDSALAKIKGVKGITSAESSKDRYRHIVGAFSALRWFARFLMAGAGFALFTGLVHLSRMNSFLHRDALRLLKFWGANRITLLTPGMVSGLLVGVLGGAIGAGIWFVAGTSLSTYVRSVSSLLKDMSPAHSSLGWVLLFAGCLIGIFSGILGNVAVSESARDGSFKP